MSIINDALKKAQQNLEQKNSATDPYDILNKNPENKKDTNNPIPHPAPPAQDPNNTKPKQEKLDDKKPKKTNSLAMAGVAILLVGAIFILLKTVIKQVPSLPKLPQVISQDKKTDNKRDADPAPAPQTQAQQDINATTRLLDLQGTMMTGQKRAALINGEVYMTGHSINGLKIIKIELESVELSDEAGNTATLGVKR